MTGPALPQRRAKAALDAITAYGNEPKVPAKEKPAYAGYIKSLPAAIVMNGLGQALATELAQGGKDTAKGQGGTAPNAHAQIYRHVEAWLCGDDPEVPFRGKRKASKPDSPVLMECLCAADQSLYLLVQAEAMEYIQWLKKFANALLVSRGSTPDDRPGDGGATPA